MSVAEGHDGGVRRARVTFRPAGPRSAERALEETRERARAAERSVLAAAGVFAATFAALAALKHHNLASSKYNLGNFVQAVWNTAHGRLLEATSDTGEQALRLSGHVEPILLLFAPA